METAEGTINPIVNTRAHARIVEEGTKMQPNRRMVALAAAAIVTAVAAAPGTIRAQDPLTPASTSVSDAELDQRIRFIEQRLEASQFHGQAWYWGWLTIDTVSLGAYGTLAATSSKTDNIVNNAVLAGNSAIGVADVLFLRPLEARLGAEPFSGMPQETRSEKITKLQAAERLLMRNAQRVEDRTSLLVQGGNVGISVASGLIVGLVGDSTDGLVTGASIFLGGLANIFSEPWEADDDLERYKALINRPSLTTEVDFYVNALADGGAKAGVRISW